MLVDGFLESASKHIGKLKNRDPESTLYKNYLNSAGDYIYFAYVFLDRLRGASAGEIYHPIVAPIIRWLKSLGMGRSILFQAENVANYEVEFFSDWFRSTNWMGLYRARSQTLTAAIEEILKSKLTVFTVPRSAFAILPNFAVIAHEIGHVFFRSISDDVIDEIKNDTEKIVKDTITKIEELKVELNDKKREFLRETLDSWTEEFAADAIAGRLAGPAAFFASSDIFQSSGLRNLQTDSHPIPSHRLSALYASLTADGFEFTGVIEGQEGIEFSGDFNNVRLQETFDFDETVNALRDEYDYDQSVILASLAETAKNLSSKVYEVVCRRLAEDFSEQIYRPEDLKRDLDEYLENLLNVIPPIEFGKPMESEKPAKFVSILNVGWIALLCRIEDFDVDVSDTPKHLRAGAKSEKLHDLLLKAVELSEAREKWQETRKKINQAPYREKP